VELIFFTRSLDGIFSSATRNYAMTTPFGQVSMVVFALAIVTRIVIGSTKYKNGEINPKHWYHDQATGEYHRIASTRGQHFTYNRDNYRDRSVRWFQRANEAERTAGGLVVAGLAVLCFAKYIEFSSHGGRALWMDLSGFVGVAVIWVGAWRWALAERGRWDMVGPVATERRVERTQTNDTRQSAGQPDLDEIDRALRSREGGPSTEPRFRV